ncbi:MAG: helix-hairpin-helix domain-containing protein [Candidatus Eisenbacteria bacterium]|nr:helix-hairpin-helix domain-containing protein [Candidatus Eisenbacteria bacterium]MCC7141694.1 helix-hairpin-helix domain-containing protein [Candidatus Eisenbacteria bacterium]
MARVEPLDAAPPGILTGTRLRISEATVEDLETLPGIGPSLAQKIAAERARGPFRAPEDLLRVPGIGPKKLAQLAAHIDFGREVTQFARKDSCDSRDARPSARQDTLTTGDRP